MRKYFREFCMSAGKRVGRVNTILTPWDGCDSLWLPSWPSVRSLHEATSPRGFTASVSFLVVEPHTAVRRRPPVLTGHTWLPLSFLAHRHSTPSRHPFIKPHLLSFSLSLTPSLSSLHIHTHPLIYISTHTHTTRRPAPMFNQRQRLPS